MEQKEKSPAEEVLAFAAAQYQTEPERLWQRYPDYLVLRHKGSRKWFGILMKVPGTVLSAPESGMLEILNVKVSDPVLHGLLLSRKGYFPAYHMNHASWISIALDGSVPMSEILEFLSESFLATAGKEERASLEGPKNWLFPAAFHVADPRHFFDNRKEITWTQSARVREQDQVFLYAGVPISCILYRCKVTAADLPADEKMRESFPNGKMMVLRLLQRYPEDAFPRELLKRDYGIVSVRGPRYVPEKLFCALCRCGNRDAEI